MVILLDSDLAVQFIFAKEIKTTESILLDLIFLPHVSLINGIKQLKGLLVLFKVNFGGLIAILLYEMLVFHHFRAHPMVVWHQNMDQTLFASNLKINHHSV
jgi:hypothetical protein